MFGEHKLSNEEGYDPEVDTLTDAKVSDENLQIIVETIFRKAQNEKEYCTFYGDLCERIIKLELNLKNMKANKKNMKNCQFRKLLLKNCKASFDQFFTEETKKLLESKDEENLLKFKARLFGNIKFVGELFRRGILQESIILSVFDMLLAVETKDI
jgi:MIF4G domain